MSKIAKSSLQGGQTFKMANPQVCQKLATLKNVVTDFMAVRAAICVTQSTRTGSRAEPQHDPPTRRLGFKRNTVLAYLSRRNFRRIPRPNRQLAMGPIWYEKSVKEWEAKEDQRRGR